MTESDAPKPEVMDYNAFLTGVTLLNIAVSKVSAERTQPGQPSNSTFQVGGGVAFEGDLMQCSFSAEAEILDSSENSVGRADATVVATFRCAEDPTPEVAERFSKTTAPVVVIPFLREAISSVATRVGLAGVNMPLFVPGVAPLGGRADNS